MSTAERRLEQISGVKKPVTPLPFKTIFTLCIVIFAEPMTFTIIFPFVYYMVRDFKISDDERNIGMYAGLIASSFSLAQFCTSLFWGWLSDRVGRRPVLLIGLIGNFISMVLFGFSDNLPWAIATRSLCGFLNGNVGVAKCILGEITDDTNQAKAFSLFGLVFDVGLLFGPMLGGLLADPSKTFPSIFGSIELFKKFPYLLPCIISAVFSLIGFIVGCFGFEETLKSKRTA
jgi:MFS family permease